MTTIIPADGAYVSVAGTAPLTLVVVLILLVLLIQREILSNVGEGRILRLSQALTIAIVPLAFVFGIALILYLINS